jgi:Arc/MetJ-type ribon-helix-helix transcriptional regulator
MANRTTLVQVRVPEGDARQLDADAHLLGLRNRSEAVREGLRLLHHHARDAELLQEYDHFYGAGAEAPVSELTALGDQIAAETMAADDAHR